MGTRTSRLALAQTALVLGMLRAAAPTARFEPTGVSTTGDRDRTVPIPDLGQGAFVKELEAALLAGKVDMAVHSLKDLPTELPPGLRLAAVPARGDPRDALVSRGNVGLLDLQAGARVGTGSPRRAAQVRAARPDLEVVMIRGNVDTRILRVDEGFVAAAVLAASGLQRLGLDDLIAEMLPIEGFPPAVGQGFLAIECREDDAASLGLAALVEDPSARRAADAERAFLAAVGGGCKAPLAAYAQIEGGRLVSLDGMVADLDGARLLRERVSGEDLSPDDAGRELRDRLYALGAEAIILAAEGPRPSP
jgi:hydroxymethylbilane synthase